MELEKRKIESILSFRPGDLVKIKKEPGSTGDDTCTNWTDEMDYLKDEFVLVDGVDIVDEYLIIDDWNIALKYVEYNLGNHNNILFSLTQQYQDKWVTCTSTNTECDFFSQNLYFEWVSEGNGDVLSHIYFVHKHTDISLVNVVGGELVFANAKSYTDILEEAKIKYPVGTKIKYPVGTKFEVVHLPEQTGVVISHDKIDNQIVRNGSVYINLHSEFEDDDDDEPCDGGAVWVDGKWAEIVDYTDLLSPVLQYPLTPEQCFPTESTQFYLATRSMVPTEQVIVFDYKLNK